MPSKKVVKERRKAWADALRSGDYKQTRQALRRSNPSGPDGFCCLGVACDVYPKGRWAASTGRETVNYRLGGDSRSSFLPIAVRNYLGLTEDQHDALMSVNDGELDAGYKECLGLTAKPRKRDFNTIADIIEGMPIL